MSPSRAAIAALIEPQLLRSLDELGFLGAVDGLRVELRLPVTNWPQREQLTEMIRHHGLLRTGRPTRQQGLGFTGLCDLDPRPGHCGDGGWKGPPLIRL